ncbi:MAG: acetoacetate decarboxylase family protein, partial [Halioglobus sp.]
MTTETGAPQGNPGDIVNWPMLKIVYRTDPDKIAALLPPGISPGANPHVNLTIYNFPVPDEPEYGIVTSVDADFDG